MIGGLPLRLYEDEQSDKNKKLDKKPINSQESDTTTLTVSSPATARTIVSTTANTTVNNSSTTANNAANTVNNANSTSLRQYNHSLDRRNIALANNSNPVNITTDYTEYDKKQQAQSILRKLHDNA